MRVHWLQHVPFENLGSIEQWIKNNGYSVASTRLYADDPLPSVDEFDFLIIMGGPMSVHDEKHYPWLKMEKRFIKEAMDRGRTVLGICLGAQLIAQALGAAVYKNTEKEIGWFPINHIASGEQSGFFDLMSDRATVFHWHGETFDLPENARHLAISEGCNHQAFSYNENILALQYHLEITEKGIANLIENCGDEIIPAPFIQSRAEMFSGIHFCESNQKFMNGTLDRLILENRKLENG